MRPVTLENAGPCRPGVAVPEDFAGHDGQGRFRCRDGAGCTPPEDDE